MNKIKAVLLATVFGGVAVGAHAQTAPPPAGAAAQPAQTAAVPGSAASANAIEEVVVTAQKRSENVQTVPLSIVAVSSQRLEDAHVTAVTDGSTAP